MIDRKLVILIVWGFRVSTGASPVGDASCVDLSVVNVFQCVNDGCKMAGFFEKLSVLVSVLNEMPQIAVFSRWADA